MKYSIAIHGGAGTIRKKDLTAEREQEYLRGLSESLEAGYTILDKGGSALDAVKAAVVVLEDNILFNAGRGSVFTNTGIHEMDAAIMDGKSLQTGAVAAVKNIRNPIELAMDVMLHSDHVFMIGEGAMEFAKGRGMKIEPDEYFFSQFRFDQWKKMRESPGYALDHSPDDDEGNLLRTKKFGTVGAVACDAHGNLAAATSTGGMTNKKYGRVGDSPLIGCGTYANNRSCAISCTGHGEPFIRAVAAHDVSCLMEYSGIDLDEAMNIVVFKKLPLLEGEGGMIGVDKNGNISMQHNSPGMYRGYKSSDGNRVLAIY